MRRFLSFRAGASSHASERSCPVTGPRPHPGAFLLALLLLPALFLLVAPAPVLGQDEPEDESEEDPWEGLPDPPPQVQPPPPPGSGPVVAVPGAEYENSGIRRLFLGRGHRELWTTPLVLPVLDLDTFGGGLVPENRGGTSQSITLHMRAPDGREYHFRSVNKWNHQGLPADLKLTPAGDLIQDQTSALHPAGALLVPPLLEAAGILHVTPRLYVMPDHPRLGEWRETFAGMVGIVEEMPNEGEDDEPLFADSRTVAGMDRLLEHLEEDPGHRANARAYLKARLVDLLIGDPDRGDDNWRWARYGAEGAYLWEPIPRDRDWAFVRADGLLPRLVRIVYPKIVTFGPDPDLVALTRQSAGQDRVILSELPRPVWDSVARSLQADLTDDAIREAAGSLPPEQAAFQADEIARLLRIRREWLDEVALEWYDRIAVDADVRATDGGDRAEIVRREDGSVEVTLLWPVDEEARALAPEDEYEEGEVPADTAGWAPYYTRRFLPGETREVRVYLHGGDDRAVVSGRGPAAIRIRVIGGGGDDHLVDASAADGRLGAATSFHDARGDNRFEPGPHTAVDTRAWEPPEPEGWIAEKLTDEDFRDWGGSTGWAPFVGYSDVAGPEVGAAHTWTRYGFRRAPWARRFRVGGRVGLRNGGLGFEAEYHVRRTNSPLRYSVAAEASTLETLRFHGYGNDTPLGPDQARNKAEERLRLHLRGGLHYDWGDPVRPSATVSLEPEVRYTDPEIPPGSALDLVRPLGVDGFGQVGVRVSGLLDRSRGSVRPLGGFALEGGAGAFPPVWDAPDWFGDVHAAARTWITPAAPVTLALRAGGERVWGDFPVHEAAFVGGRETLRGFRFRRFAGDAMLHGTAELRVELAEIVLLTRGRVGVTGLTDVGRVWFDGESPGGWHSGYGAGVWFESLDAVLRATWARGEEDRFYVGLGMSF